MDGIIFKAGWFIRYSGLRIGIYKDESYFELGKGIEDYLKGKGIYDGRN